MTPQALESLIESKAESRDVILSILNIMAELKIDRIEFEYRGSGDSPDGADATFYKFNGIKTTVDENGNETHVEDWELDGPAQGRFEPYDNIVDDFVLNLSCDIWGGWYNDEGGHGTGVFTTKGVPEPCFTIEHYSWHTEEVHEGEHTYSATKDGETH